MFVCLLICKEDYLEVNRQILMKIDKILFVGPDQILDLVYHRTYGVGGHSVP